MIVLGIESSCDETAVALVDDAGTILAEKVFSQLDEHAPFGGVVPEIAARRHLDLLFPLLGKVLDAAAVKPQKLSAIAATAGPGLIGGLIVGLSTAKMLALSWQKPLYALNHLEGHALTARLTDGIAFPYLLLLVSGGHCQLVSVTAVGQYKVLGSTIDDAAGEAFDKVAKMLGLGYPGGPALERLAREGNPKAFDLPRPLKGKPGCDFSFSGLKTAVLYTAQKSKNKQGSLSWQDKANLAASFQLAVAESLYDRICQAQNLLHNSNTPLVIAGGVAANQFLKEYLSEHLTCPLITPPLRLCTDNAVMIAWAGIERLKIGKASDDLTFKPQPRWRLDSLI